MIYLNKRSEGKRRKERRERYGREEWKENNREDPATKPKTFERSLDLCSRIFLKHAAFRKQQTFGLIKQASCVYVC